MGTTLDQFARDTASYIKWAKGSLRHAAEWTLPSEAVADIQEAERILDTLMEKVEAALHPDGATDPAEDAG